MVFSMQSAVHCTVVGDGFVGKSCLVQKIAGGKFHQEYVATLKDSYSTNLSLNGDSFEMNITDIAGEVSKGVFFKTVFTCSWSILSFAKSFHLFGLYW